MNEWQIDIPQLAKGTSKYLIERLIKIARYCSKQYHLKAWPYCRRLQNLVSLNDLNCRDLGKKISKSKADPLKRSHLTKWKTRATSGDKLATISAVLGKAATKLYRNRTFYFLFINHHALPRQWYHLALSQHLPCTKVQTSWSSGSFLNTFLCIKTHFFYFQFLLKNTIRFHNFNNIFSNHIKKLQIWINSLTIFISF